MSTSLARLHASARTELAQVAPIDEFRILDKYAGGVADERPRVPWLATISAGQLVQRGDQTIPRASRKTDEQWIHMTAEDQERAPGLYAALEAARFRWLDVALPFDDPNLFLQQHFEKRSATRLEAYGDQFQITEILVRRQGERVIASERRIHPAGSADYDRLVRECNVSVSVFFALAEWDGRQPRIYFPSSDGLGVYRLRFTSRNSLREIIASLRQISGLTGGRLAGIPLRLSLDWREVADQTGARRTIPVWRLRFMPPEGLRLTPGLWRELASEGLQQGQLLRLPAPSVESIEDAVQTVDPDLDEPEDSAIDGLQAGPPCDARFYQQAWFARVKDTSLDSDEARAEFLREHTHGQVESLTEFLAVATEEQAAGLLAAAGRRVASQDAVAKARRYDEVFGDEDAWDRKGHVPQPERLVNADGDVVDTQTGEILEDRAVDASPAQAAPQGRAGESLPSSARRPCVECGKEVLDQSGQPINDSQEQLLLQRFGSRLCRECRGRERKL